MANPGHTGRRWRTLVTQLKAAQQTCAECAKPIDLTIRYPDPMSFSADYRIPYSQGGPMRLDNLRATHLKCNRDRGARPVANPVSRQW